MRVPAACATGAGDVVDVVVVVVVSPCAEPSATASDVAAGASAQAHASRITAFFKTPPPRVVLPAVRTTQARLGLAKLARLHPCTQAGRFPAYAVTVAIRPRDQTTV